jgi:hypothetical protein
MSAGSFGTEPNQGNFPQPGPYAPPASAQFRQDYGVAPRRTNSLAIAALCCGIGQLVAGPFAGIPAIVLGAMSLRQIRQTSEDGQAMAVIGLVLGIVGTILFALAIAFVVVVASNIASQGLPG